LNINNFLIGLFVSGLPEETVIKEDVDIARLVADFKIDYERKTVTAYYKYSFIYLFISFFLSFLIYFLSFLFITDGKKKK